MAAVEERGIVLEIIDIHLYTALSETISRIRPLAERIIETINQLIENIRSKNIQNISPMASELRLLVSNLLTYTQNIASTFRNTISRLSITLDVAEKQNKTDILSKTITAQRRLQDEIDYLITLKENLQKLILLCKDFSEDNPQNIENIQNAAKTEAVVNWLAHVNATINSLLINEKTSIITKVNEIRSAVS